MKMYFIAPSLPPPPLRHRQWWFRIALFFYQPWVSTGCVLKKKQVMDCNKSFKRI